MKIALYYRHIDPADLPAFDHLCAELQRAGIATQIVHDADSVDGFNYLFSIGGDGTLLSSVQFVHSTSPESFPPSLASTSATSASSPLQARTTLPPSSPTSWRATSPSSTAPFSKSLPLHLPIPAIRQSVSLATTSPSMRSSFTVLRAPRCCAPRSMSTTFM